MIEPTEKDIGRKVIYRGGAGEIEEGVITSFKNGIIFVRYGKSVGSQATTPTDLEYAFPAS